MEEEESRVAGKSDETEMTRGTKESTKGKESSESGLASKSDETVNTRSKQDITKSKEKVSGSCRNKTKGRRKRGNEESMLFDRLFEARPTKR